MDRITGLPVVFAAHRFGGGDDVGTNGFWYRYSAPWKPVVVTLSS